MGLILPNTLPFHTMINQSFTVSIGGKSLALLLLLGLLGARADQALIDKINKWKNAPAAATEGAAKQRAPMLSAKTSAFAPPNAPSPVSARTTACARKRARPSARSQSARTNALALPNPRRNPTGNAGCPNAKTNVSANRLPRDGSAISLATFGLSLCAWSAGFSRFWHCYLFSLLYNDSARFSPSTERRAPITPRST